jgi:hypothetical protein
MKKYAGTFFILVILCCFGCSTQKCLQKRTDRLIEKSLKNSDIIYRYSVAFNDFNLVWYHKGDYLYSFYIKPYKTKKFKPVEAKDIIVSQQEMDKYFGENAEDDILCFPSNMLDGEGICIYIKNKNHYFWQNFDSNCLFNTKFEENSFPYKLQYDYSRILKSKDFDFEKMYSQ